MLDNILMGFTSISLNKGRSFLTMLGIVIGVAAVVLIFAIIQGVKKDITQSIEGLGSNVVVVVPGKVQPGRFFNPGNFSSDLTFNDVASIQKIKGVDKISPMTVISNSIKSGGQSDSTAINVGADQTLMGILGLRVDKGRFLSKSDVDTSAPVVVLGAGPASALFPNGDALGKTVTVKGQPLVVIGVLDRAPSTASFGGVNLDGMAIVPYTTSQKLLGSSLLARILATGKDGDVSLIKGEITQALKRNHNGSDEFTVLTQQDILQTANRIIDTFASMIVSIAAISVLVGGIGIMNMMLVSVTERTREIGIRKALGATSGNILVQFLFESVALSFAGAVAGLLLAYVTSALLNRYSDTLHPYITPVALALALLMAFAVGVVFGIAPALRAASKKPIEALRYE